MEFLEPSEARKAFAKLAYTKFKHLPLYLEWAPDNSFSTPPADRTKATNVESNKKTEKQETVNATEQVEKSSEKVNDENKVNKKEESEDEEESEPDTTLFVKNINFATTEEQLKTVFTIIGIYFLFFYKLIIRFVAISVFQ